MISYLRIGTDESDVFDVGTLVEETRQVMDRRQKREQRYLLSYLLVVIVLAKVLVQNKLGH